MSTETLICAEGQHTWERERTRGRKPAYCPTHLPFIVRSVAADSAVSTRENGSASAERRNRPVIEQVLATRRSCQCEIRADMSNDQLMRMKSCKVAFVCPVLDKLRRRLQTF